MAQPLSGKWLQLFTRQLLTRESYEKLNHEQREQEIRRRWTEFLDNDLPRIEAALKRETWIWESVKTNEEHSDNPSRFVWGEGDVEIREPPEHEE